METIAEVVAPVYTHARACFLYVCLSTYVCVCVYRCIFWSKYKLMEIYTRNLLLISSGQPKIVDITFMLYAKKHIYYKLPFVITWFFFKLQIFLSTTWDTTNFVNFTNHIKLLLVVLQNERCCAGWEIKTSKQKICLL